MSNTERPDVPVFDLPIEVVVKAMHKISGRSWCILGFSHTLCGKEISSPQLQIWVGQNQNLTTQQWDSLHLPTPPHDSWVHSNGTYYRPISDSDCHFQAGTRECCLPEYPESTIRVSTVVVTGINARQAMVEPSTLPWFTHTLDISNSCAMTPGGQSPSSQQFDSDTVHLPTTPTLTDLLQDLVRDLHYAHLRTQAYNMNRVFVEPPRDGMQSCLYHIFGAFVGQPMSQVRRSLGTWYLQPVNQATLCDFLLPTDLQSPPACVQRSRSGVDPSNLADECNVHSLGLLFDISFQILSSSTSVQVINIHGTRGMIIGHVNSTRVKHFIVTKLLRNTGNVSSTVTLYPMEVPAVHQNVTQNKRRKVNVPPDPTVQLNTWHNGPPRHLALEHPFLTKASYYLIRSHTRTAAVYLFLGLLGPLVPVLRLSITDLQTNHLDSTLVVLKSPLCRANRGQMLWRVIRYNWVTLLMTSSTHGLTVRLLEWHLVLEVPSLTKVCYHLTRSRTQTAVV